MSLVALGVGYLVLLQANKEKEGLRILGQAIGILIMIGAVISAICGSKCRGHEECLLSGKAPICPFTAKHMEAPTE